MLREFQKTLLLTKKQKEAEEEGREGSDMEMEEEEVNEPVEEEEKEIGFQVSPYATLKGYRRLNITEAQAKKFDTHWVLGQKRPAVPKPLLLKDGCTVPLGKMGPVQWNTIQDQKRNFVDMQPSVQADEFVVRDPERVRVRYIVHLQPQSVAAAAAKTIYD